MARMRTIKAAVEHFRRIDPDTCITEHFLRTEARAGKLPGVVRAGCKYLINIDVLEEFLDKSNTIKNNTIQEYSKLRKISV